jgi:hypothetical protein
MQRDLAHHYILKKKRGFIDRDPRKGISVAMDEGCGYHGIT